MRSGVNVWIPAQVNICSLAVVQTIASKLLESSAPCAASKAKAVLPDPPMPSIEISPMRAD